MTTADVDRASDARLDIRTEIADRSAGDEAIRIVELVAPADDGSPLALNPRFSILTGLTDEAKHRIGETVLSLYTRPGRPDLAGTVLVDGLRRSLAEQPDPAERQTAGPAAIFRDHSDTVAGHSIAWADPIDLQAVVDALEVAIRLTAAELRGADQAARAARIEDGQPAELIDLTDAHDDEAEDLEEAVELLDRIAADPRHFDELEALLAEIDGVEPLADVDSEVAQYAAALSRLAPSDPAALRADLEAKLAAAERVRDSHLLERRVFVDRLVDVLDELGVDADIEKAPEVAERVLGERQEIAELRARLESRRSELATITEPPPAASPDLERHRSRLRRRLQSQQRILAATREQLAYATREPIVWSELPGRTVTPTNSDGRPLPILVEDPTVDLPVRHGASALSVLLRLSELTQVVCISDDPDLARWSNQIGDRVELIEANGWFAREGRRS